MVAKKNDIIDMKNILRITLMTGIISTELAKLAFAATYGVSKEDQIISIKAGFLFL